MVHEYERRGGGALDMPSFRQEIGGLKRTDTDPHLPDLDPDALTEYDARTWMLLKSGTLTASEFKQRSNAAVRNLTRDDSRSLFYAYIGNELSNRLAEEQMAKMDAEKNRP